MGEDNTNLTKVSYAELIDLLDRLEEGSAISVVVCPGLGDAAFMFGVGLEQNTENSKRRDAKIACVRKLHYAKMIDAELTGTSNGKAIFRKIKSFMETLGIKINKYSPEYAVDTETYNKLMGITEEEDNDNSGD